VAPIRPVAFLRRQGSDDVKIAASRRYNRSGHSAYATVARMTNLSSVPDDASIPEGHMQPTTHGRQVNPWLVLAVVCFAQFMVVLDATIVNIALPSIQTDLKLSDSNLQWIVNAYTLVFGGFLMLGGRLADLLGRRMLFLTGIVIFSVASLVNALSVSGEMLIVARGFQGLGGALASPAALSIVISTFDEGPTRTKALAIWGAIAAGGSAFGLLLGGALTETLDWRWNFIINIPIGIAVVLATLSFVPESRHETAERHFDVAGAVTITGGLMALVYAIVNAEKVGWGSTESILWFAGAFLLLAAFVVIELRSPQPLVRLSFFKQRWITAANLTMLVVAGAMFAMFFFISLYVQRILGYNPLKAGLAFLPATAGIMTGAAISQQTVDRIGVKPVLMTGLSLVSIGLFVLSVTTQVDGTYLHLLTGLVPMALGMGMTFVPLTLVATSGVPPADAGLASGVFNTSQQIGGALGLAILSTLSSNRSANVIAEVAGRPRPSDLAYAMVEGFQTAFIVAAGLALVGLLMVTFVLRKKDIQNVSAADANPVAI
jgi:EmrB/QacA subfamily drug resistance transporter